MAAVDKDRRSRMAYQTVNAPLKKGGAGGSYTWGAAGEVMDYVPAQVQPLVVTSGAYPVAMMKAAPASPFNASISSTQQFPTLGSQTVVAAPAPARAWGGWTQVQGNTYTTTKPAGAQMVTVQRSNTADFQQQDLSRTYTGDLSCTYTGPVYSMPTSQSFTTGAAPARVVHSTRVPVEKDRRSRMVISTVNAPSKKDGAGGSFTWGSTSDAIKCGSMSEAIDYVPISTTESKVTVAPAPIFSQPVAAPFTTSISSLQQFPSLRSQKVATWPQDPWAAGGDPWACSTGLLAPQVVAGSDPWSNYQAAAAPTGIAQAEAPSSSAAVEPAQDSDDDAWGSYAKGKEETEEGKCSVM